MASCMTARPSPRIVSPKGPIASREERPSVVWPSKPNLPKSPSGEATLAYWNAVNDVIAREGAMRAAPANLTAGNAGGFVEARSLRVGPFLTVVAGLVGVELYGIGGALLAVAWLTLAAAVLGELAPSPKEQARPPEMGDFVQHGERAHATP